MYFGDNLSLDLYRDGVRVSFIFDIPREVRIWMKFCKFVRVWKEIMYVFYTYVSFLILLREEDLVRNWMKFL